MTPVVSSTLLRTQSDARLAALAAEGSERAFEAIVDRYRRPLLRYSRRILPEARAEDAVQQTWLKAWSALSRGVEVSDLKPWLYRIALTTSLDAAKRAGYDFAELDDSLRLAPGADEDLERRAVMRETLSGLAALPSNQREALLRTAVEGDSRADIARDLGVTDGAVRQLVHRARTTLRAAATAVTPFPLIHWAAAAGSPSAPAVERIAELAAVGGSAGVASFALKAGGAVVAAGVIAAGATGELGKVTGGNSSSASSSSSSTTATTAGPPAPHAGGDGAAGSAPDRRRAGEDRDDADRDTDRTDDRSGRGDGDDVPSGGEDRSGSNSGPGSGSEPPESEPSESSSGPGSGSSVSGSSDSGSSGSGSSGSGSSGPGTGPTPTTTDLSLPD